MADQFIGNYKVIKKVGAGGMAQVYLAVHKDIPNLKVVLKILSDARLVERFRQEADKLALLDGHANVCRIKHFFNHGDDFVIAMEFIDGTPLDEIIKEEKKLPVDDSLKIISDVLATLEFAHQKDIFHRDIKPGNIMVDNSGQVKIIDFGIAKSKTDPNLTIAGTACGTPAYMPPEQFNPTGPIDYGLVDVYAVGTTLFFMLTGKLPFEGDNAFALRDAKMFNDPPKPRDINPDIPKELDRIILKALAKNPEDRFASADEMKTTIDALRRDPETPELTIPIRQEIPKAPSFKKQSSKKMPLIAALVVVVCVVAAYLMFFRESKPPLPTGPTLLSPAPETILDNDLPTFTWQGPDDVDAAFILEYAADSLFADPIEKRVLAVSTYTVPAALANGRYYWRVQTVDRTGNKSELSPSFSFIIDIARPAVPKANLAIIVRPRGDIYIDNELHGKNKSDATLTLDTGQHMIRVINRGSEQKELSQSVHLVDGAEEGLSFEFTFPIVATMADSGEVVIGSWPTDGGAIFIDGELQDLRTNNTFRLPIGKHIIKVVLEIDGEELEKVDSVFVEKNSHARKRFDFEN
jgi:serine/threonine protein kinase